MECCPLSNGVASYSIKYYPALSHIILLDTIPWLTNTFTPLLHTDTHIHTHTHSPAPCKDESRSTGRTRTGPRDSSCSPAFSELQRIRHCEDRGPWFYNYILIVLQQIVAFDCMPNLRYPAETPGFTDFISTILITFEMLPFGQALYDYSCCS